MSGEAVIVTAPVAAVVVAGPILLAGAAIAGTVAVGAFAVKGVALGVAAIIDRQVEAARRRAVEERARVAEWEAFQRRQQAAMEEARQRHEAMAQMQQRLAQVRLQDPLPKSASDMETGAIKARGYVAPAATAAPDREALARTLGAISSAIDALPESLRTHPDSPITALRQQVDGYLKRVPGSRPPDATQIAALKTTAEQSVERFLTRLEAERSEREKRVARADAALNLLLMLEQLPAHPGDGLAALRRQLVGALESGDITAAQIDEIEKRLKALAEKTAERVASGVLRPALAESLLRHLRALGYEVLVPFPAELGETEVDAGVGVPGGGQVAIQLDTKGRLRFKFAHERAVADDRPMDADEIAFARQQEARWCKDLKAVTARLVAEGFDSKVTLDRKLTVIPVVVHVRVTAETTEEMYDGASEAAESARAAEDERRLRRIRAEQQAKPRRLS